MITADCDFGCRDFLFFRVRYSLYREAGWVMVRRIPMVVICEGGRKEVFPTAEDSAMVLNAASMTERNCCGTERR